MKSILLLLSFSLLINTQTNAQRNKRDNGRGQESGNIERIDDSQDRRNTVQPPERRENRNTKGTEIKQTRRPNNEKQTTPIEGTDWVFCPEKTSVCDGIVDNSYYRPSNEVLAIQYFESGDFGRALINVEQAIKSDLFNPGLYFLRGKIYFELSDYILAKRDFYTVQVFDPEFAEAYYYHGMCNLFLGDKQKAKKDFETAASLGDTVAEKFLLDYLN